MRNFKIFNRLPFALLLVILVALPIALMALSCGDDDDDDDSDDSQTQTCQHSYEDACEFITDIQAPNDSDLNCVDAFEFGFETVKECHENIIEPLLDSENPCEVLAGECLNTMSEIDEECSEVTPTSCENAWEIWSECLVIAEQEDC